MIGWDSGLGVRVIPDRPVTSELRSSMVRTRVWDFVGYFERYKSFWRFRKIGDPLIKKDPKKGHPE